MDTTPALFTLFYDLFPVWIIFVLGRIFCPCIIGSFIKLVIGRFIWNIFPERIDGLRDFAVNWIGWSLGTLLIAAPLSVSKFVDSVWVLIFAVVYFCIFFPLSWNAFMNQQKKLTSMSPIPRSKRAVNYLIYLTIEFAVLSILWLILKILHLLELKYLIITSCIALIPILITFWYKRNLVIEGQNEVLVEELQEEY